MNTIYLILTFLITFPSLLSGQGDSKLAQRVFTENKPTLHPAEKAKNKPRPKKPTVSSGVPWQAPKTSRQLFEVVILTRDKDVPIFADDELIGRTNSDHELFTRLAEGTYNFTARYADDLIVEKTVRIEKNRSVKLIETDKTDDEPDNDEESPPTLIISPTELPRSETPLYPVTMRTLPPLTEKASEILKNRVSFAPKPETFKNEKAEILLAIEEETPEEAREPVGRLIALIERYVSGSPLVELSQTEWQFLRTTLLSGETSGLPQDEVELFQAVALARLDRAAGNRTTALAGLREAIQRNSRSPFPYFEAAQIHFEQRQFAVAAGFYKAAVEFNRRFEPANVGLARSLLASGDLRAAGNISATLTLDQFSSTAKRLLFAEIAFASRRFEEALEILGNGSAPADIIALRADALVKLGRFTPAQAELRAALKIHPDDPALLSRLGFLLAASEPFSARRLLERAIQLDASGLRTERNEIEKTLRKIR